MTDANVPPYAHNLVSSLYVIKGLLESFLRQHREGGGGEILQRVYGQASHALAIAKKLEQVAACAPENGHPKSSDFKVSIKGIWRNTLRLLKKDFSLEQIEILERIPEPFPPVRCHPADFGEILYHLSRNSLEAMQGKGKLIVRAHLSLSPQEQPFAMIHLADTGPGIPAPVLFRLFLPFSTTKRGNGGTGLGLFLTHQLVRRNQGRIIVSSFKGFGTTFTLGLPLACQRD